MATFDDVRRLALALPEVQEKPHFGMPAFRVADKGFVSVTKDHARVLLHLDPADVAAELALGDCQHSAWRHRAPRAVIRRHQA